MKSKFVTVVAMMLWCGTAAAAQNRPSPAADPELDELLSLDLNDLTVTSVSKRPEKLSTTAAAVYVITQEDIRRSGATTIPDLLRMVPGLEVAQAASNRWAIASRGFNNVLSNKLLVMIDGRSIYTPVFSGVYWDDQSTLIADIDRIEVIRGPGASLYGANAVDGVINIITKNAADTQGNYASAGVGTSQNFVEARHGGRTDNDTFYRAYGQYQHFSPLLGPSGSDNFDSWYRARSGFRIDRGPFAQDGYTLEGDAYYGRQDASLIEATPMAPFSQTSYTYDTSYGADLLGRWRHEISPDSNISVQAYVDHYSRLEANAIQHVTTTDLQLQHNVKIDDRNNFIWGAGARVYFPELGGTFSAGFGEPDTDHYVLNTFAQDEFAVVRDKLFFTLGSKFEWNDFTGFEYEPTARLSWRLDNQQTVWAAVSRAVRMPSIYEENVRVEALIAASVPPTSFRIVGNPDQKSEDVVAYEIGHRIQPLTNLSFDTTLFYNQFDNLQTFAAAGTPFLSNGLLVVPFAFDNLGDGRAYGAEVSSTWNVTSNWRLMASYTYLMLDLRVEPGTAATLNGQENLAPRNQFSLRSYWNVTRDIQWDNMLYYVSALPAPSDAYFRYDTRIGWQVMPGVEASLVGQNLLQHSHAEFPYTPQAEIPRSLLARLTWNF